MVKTQFRLMLPCGRRWPSLSFLGQMVLVLAFAIAWLSGAWLSGANANRAHAAPPGWDLTWSDEFNGTSVDSAKWDRINWTTPFNNEQQAYHPSRATVSGGNLVLTADDANYGGKSYTSGKVESVYTQQYGRWEVRAKLPGTQGTWPAIWLLPDTDIYGWPSQGEIDIMENRGHQPSLVSSAYHWGPNFQGHQYVSDTKSYSGASSGNYHNEFHTYAVEWSASELKFFVDDVPYHTVTDAQTGGFLSGQTAPVETVLNVAVGGDFLGSQQPNASSQWSQEMLVDYVRIYEKTPAMPGSFINGSFEDSGGSLDGWTPFGNSVPNVLASSEAVRTGQSSLKIFGQFNGSQNFSGVTQGIAVTAGDQISAAAHAYVRSGDALAADNSVALNIDYYSVFGGDYGTADYLSTTTLSIADASTQHDSWLLRTLADTVPTGAVEARLAFAFQQPSGAGGAIHLDDVTFENLGQAFDADGNADGQVDGLDFLAWQQGFGTATGASGTQGDYTNDSAVDAADLAAWLEQFGTVASSSEVAGTAVPEPTTLALVLGLLAAAMPCRTRSA